jgi:hypothetical protein
MRLVWVQLVAALLGSAAGCYCQLGQCTCGARSGAQCNQNLDCHPPPMPTPMPTPNPATELEDDIEAIGTWRDLEAAIYKLGGDKTVTLTLTKSFTMEGYTGPMEIEYGGHLTIMGSGAVLDTQGAGAACSSSPPRCSFFSMNTSPSSTFAVSDMTMQNGRQVSALSVVIA